MRFATFALGVLLFAAPASAKQKKCNLSITVATVDPLGNIDYGLGKKEASRFLHELDHHGVKGCLVGKKATWDYAVLVHHTRRNYVAGSDSGDVRSDIFLACIYRPGKPKLKQVRCFEKREHTRGGYNPLAGGNPAAHGLDELFSRHHPVRDLLKSIAQYLARQGK